MNKLLKYILIAVLAMAIVACAKNEEVTLDESTGRLQLQFALPGKTRAAAYDALAFSTLRVYKMENGEPQLIRKYHPATTTPADIYLIEGDYKVTIDAGDKSEATFDHKSYYGEQAFTLVAKQPQIVMVECKITNVAVRVEFEQAVHDKLDKGFVAYVSAADAFSLTEAENNSVPSLKYGDKRDTTGFFTLPKEVTNLSWGLYGEGSIVGKIEKTGIIAAPIAGKQYTLTFKYSKTPDGFLKVVVSIKEYEEKFDDNFIFSPQPTISGDNFAIDEVQGYVSQPIRYKLTSIDDISTATVTAGGVTYPLLNTGAVIDPGASANGLSYTAEDAFNGIITIDRAFFAKLPGGIHDLTFHLADKSNIEGKAVAKVAIEGTAAMSEIDLWANSATLSAIVTNPDITEATIHYRSGTGEWQQALATKIAPFTFSAKVEPTWSKLKNSKNQDIYTPDPATGIWADRTYEHYATIGGVQKATVTTKTAAGDAIPTLNNSGLSCYGNSNGSTDFWGSGNNGTTSNLCKYDGGVGGAKVAGEATGTTNIVGMFGPGNLFTGTFGQSGMNGTVWFGKKYTYTARPSAFTVQYKASIGNVNYAKHESFIAKGSPDKASVYAVIIDWKSTHGVTAGVGYPSGMWSPDNGADAVSEGKIIGYALLYIEGETPDMTTKELQFYFYDKTAKPTPNNYSIVIACASSAYGDYINGCSSNVMYMKDFSWKY